jgi:DNA-binding protein YbaB
MFDALKSLGNPMELVRKAREIKVRIDKTKIDVNDTEMLEDVITAAIAAAQAKAADMMREQMQKMAADAGLPAGMLPGM